VTRIPSAVLVANAIDVRRLILMKVQNLMETELTAFTRFEFFSRGSF
jgi:hypothetical protein